MHAKYPFRTSLCLSMKTYKKIVCIVKERKIPFSRVVRNIIENHFDQMGAKKDGRTTKV